MAQKKDFALSNIIIYDLDFFAELYRAIFDTSAERSEAHVLKGCIKNCSIVKLYKIITNKDCVY